MYRPRLETTTGDVLCRQSQCVGRTLGSEVRHFHSASGHRCPRHGVGDCLVRGNWFSAGYVRCVQSFRSSERRLCVFRGSGSCLQRMMVRENDDTIALQGLSVFKAEVELLLRIRTSSG